jgi:hypothetical protein
MLDSKKTGCSCSDPAIFGQARKSQCRANSELIIDNKFKQFSCHLGGQDCFVEKTFLYIRTKSA